MNKLEMYTLSCIASLLIMSNMKGFILFNIVYVVGYVLILKSEKVRKLVDKVKDKLSDIFSSVED